MGILKNKLTLMLLTLIISVIIVWTFIPEYGIYGLYSKLFGGLICLLVGICFIALSLIVSKRIHFKINTKEYFIGFLILIRTILLLFILLCSCILVIQALFYKFSLTADSVIMKILGVLFIFLIVKLVPRYRKHCKEHPSKQGEIVAMILIPVALMTVIVIGLYKGSTDIYNASLDVINEDIKEMYIYDISVTRKSRVKAPTSYFIVGEDENKNKIQLPIYRELYYKIRDSSENEKKRVKVRYYPRTKILDDFQVVKY